MPDRGGLLAFESSSLSLHFLSFSLPVHQMGELPFVYILVGYGGPTSRGGREWQADQAHMDFVHVRATVILLPTWSQKL